MATDPPEEHRLAVRAKDKQLLPFRRWRCLCNPRAALDPEQCEAYTKITIKIERARCLPQTEVMDTSDPYATVAIDGKVAARTQTMHRTHAPWWNETHVLDIRHPLSVLNICVWDSDYGTNMQGFDMLGTDDDLLGWLDLPMKTMPQGRWVGGWFRLLPESEFRDTVAGRMKNTPQYTQKPPEICVYLKLEKSRFMDDLFALCLPYPDHGHGCPPLDLMRLDQEVRIALSTLSMLGQLAQDTIEKWLSSWWMADITWPVLIVLILVWFPSYLVPFIVMVLVCIILMAFAHREKIRQKHRQEVIPALGDFDNVYSTLDTFLPEDTKVALRQAHAQLGFILDLTEMIEDVLSLPAVRKVVVLSIVLLLALLVSKPGWQAVVLQVLLTWIVIVNFADQTIPGRFALAILGYVGLRFTTKQRPVRKTLALPSSMDHQESWRSEHRLSHALLTNEVTISAANELPRAMCMHDLQDQTFTTPQWCHRCLGRGKTFTGFLWGMHKQGLRCARCDLVLCKSCAMHAATVLNV